MPELPYLTFDGRARFGTAHWKLEALDEYAGSRPLAWIDDSLDASCYEWADERPAPTLLVPTESDVGLLDAHVEALEAWVADGFEPGSQAPDRGVDSPGWERWCRSSSWP